MALRTSRKKWRCTVRVDIWAEVTCPWCGLGHHRLQRAIERFERAGGVEVVHHSFPLSSSFPRTAPSPSARLCCDGTVWAALRPRRRPGGSRHWPQPRV
nr:DsbA family protein [Streptomyces sp. CdTB01]